MNKIRANIAPGEDKVMCRLLIGAIETAYAAFDFDFDAQVDVSLVDETEIRQINREYRGVDRVTDVLSFPMLIFHEGQLLEEVLPDPETGRVFLGDILLCPTRAAEQAAEYGHSSERECAYLAVHSMLHLVGYDHEDEGEEKIAMRAMEEAIMDKLKLGRDA